MLAASIRRRCCWCKIGRRFSFEIAKTIRGYGGASIFASQDLADFFDLDGGRFGKGIINNSKTKIILNLEDDEAQRVQEALHLSDAETMEITHFERGHGLISTNNNNIMVEFKASPLEKDLITTDRRELREIVERKRREQYPHLPNSRYNNLKSEVIPMCNFPARRRYASALRLHYA